MGDLSQAGIINLLLLFLGLILSVGFHEFSHVLSAYLQGDHTGKEMGRLTLNPIRHLDPFGTMFMLAAVFTGIGIGWGKPAPFNPYNLRNRRWGSALVAMAGPVSNIVLMTMAGYALLLIGPSLSASNLLVMFLVQFVLINASLALFNLLPITPLDGSHLITAWLGNDHPLVVVLQRYGIFLLLALIVIGGNVLGGYIFGGARILLHAVGLGSLI